MRKLKNTLYITKPEAYLSRDGENIVIKIDGKEIGRRPIHLLESIICFHYTGMNGALLRLCAEHGVSVSFMDSHGRFCGRVQGRINGNVLLRRKQFRVADSPENALSIARHMVLAKIVNGRKILSRALRDHPGQIGRAHV